MLSADLHHKNTIRNNRHPPACFRTPILKKHSSWKSRTESQNGRGWKGPLEITQSNPPAKQGHLEHIAQDGIQVGFDYLQRRLHNLDTGKEATACKRIPKYM